VTAEIATYPVSADEVIAFLASDPIGNVELLTALRYDGDVRCVGAGRAAQQTNITRLNGDRLTDPSPHCHNQPTGASATTGDVHALAGVLVAGREGMTGSLTARIATDDPDALSALIRAIPPGTTRFVVERAWMLPMLAARLRLIPEDDPETLFSLATMPTLPAPGVRLLAMADAPMMAASATLWGRMGLIDALRAGFRPFGIVHGARVIACAMAANVTDWTEEVMSVWTAPRHRNEGFATAVVAATAADIIARGRIATYVASVTNGASQRVAEKVGFQRAYDIVAYRVQR
jgi:ribosomal protein S18 acetylase RimI-like enzyme